MKRILSLVLALVLVLSMTTAFAGTKLNNGGSSSLSSIPPFKFEHMKKGFGRGTCPVYSAPYTDAYRAANGKACVDTNSYIDVGGFDERGWMIVRYETNKGQWRVGWIPPKYVKGVSTKMAPHFTSIEMVADETLYVTDDNLSTFNKNRCFATIDPGENYYVVGRYNYHGDWWYVEFDLEGQVARGFTPVKQKPTDRHKKKRPMSGASFS
ncbi:MAG: hypothetical protein Q4C54_03050 [Clostridia bacterium]|nr:hypothetical protein [Clostridia bacterium]